VSWDGNTYLDVMPGSRTVVSQSLSSALTYETFVYDTVGTLYFSARIAPADGQWTVWVIENPS